MIEWRSFEEVKRGTGLRLVLVQGIASPWGVAAKAIFDHKGVPWIAAPWLAGEANEDVVAWSGADSAPVVVWNDERPIDRWLDVLMLAERIAPTPRLVPEGPATRALMVGLTCELCGELGLGWNRRLQLFDAIVRGGEPPAGVLRMAAKYRYSAAAAAQATRRTVAQLEAFTAQLERQQAAGSRFLVGDALSALDFYFVAFMNLVALQPAEECPMDAQWREIYRIGMDDPALAAAVDPVLVAHRDRIFREYFRNPMEF
ncbi:MAG TPA: hypothetical protein PJ986_17375 [Gammaproteobacteria bacterium]|nr:hypothetical protein [Gammaproteobacteria bacterium]